MEEETSEKYRLLRNREDNRKYFFSKEEITSEQQKVWFESYLKKSDQYMFSVHLSETGEFIGGLGFYALDDINHSAEFGRIIIDRKKVSGKGFGSKAIAAVTNIAFNELDIIEAYAYIYSNNIASMRSFKNAGYSIDKDNSNESIVKVVKFK